MNSSCYFTITLNEIDKKFVNFIEARIYVFNSVSNYCENDNIIIFFFIFIIIIIFYSFVKYKKKSRYCRGRIYR